MIIDRVRCRLLRAIVAAFLVLAAPLAASTATMQAPSSRVVLDLPAGFEPSQLFSGFTSEATGASFVVVEMPAAAYDELAAGMTPEALARKGVRNASRGALQRQGAHVFMRAEQSSAAGTFAKFFVVFRESDVTALVTANVPKAALEKGDASAAAIEAALASAHIAASPAPAKELFALAYTGELKPAGSFLGSARTYNLDGRMPSAGGQRLPMLIVAPSLDRRQVGDHEAYAESLLAGLAEASDIRVSARTKARAAGLDGVEIVASARSEAVGDIVLYQLVLFPRAGGYWRLVGQMPAAQSERWLAEMRRIAEGFRLIE